MIKHYFLYNLRYILFLIAFIIATPFFPLKAENKEIVINQLQIFKKNKASCHRLGNIYDACHWMAKFTVKNKSKNTITTFCLRMKVNKKNYQLCYGEKKKISINANNKKIFLVNLTELFKISADDERPFVKIFTVR